MKFLKPKFHLENTSEFNYQFIKLIKRVLQSLLRKKKIKQIFQLNLNSTLLLSINFFDKINFLTNYNLLKILFVIKYFLQPQNIKQK